jgi:MFS transporter, MHS family, proline/betaine transporter
MYDHSHYKYASKILMIGTFLEYFDLMLYVHMASILNDVFFDAHSTFDQKYGVAVGFSSTFFLKPFGGLLWGWLGDRIGRKKVLFITMLLMAGCCAIIATLPPFAQIGVAASLTVTICRMIQGLAAVGEATGAEIYMAENILPPRRYFATALIAYAGVIGMVGAMIAVNIVIFFEINWRYIFWFGATVAIFGFFVRLKLRESPEFLSAYNKLRYMLNIDSTTKKGKEELKHKKLDSMLRISSIRTKISYFCSYCGWPLCFYFSYVYCGDILKQECNFTKEMVIHQNLILSLVNLVGLGFMVYLTRFVHPLKILKFKLFIYIPFLCIVPSLITSQNSSIILFVQSMGVVFGNSTIPARGVFLMHFGTLERFKFSAFLNGLSHFCLYLITAFGITYLRDLMGVYGILVISLLLTGLFSYGVREFINMEKKIGAYF